MMACLESQYLGGWSRGPNLRPVWSAQQDPAGEEEKGVGEILLFVPFLDSYILLQTQWAPPRTALSSHQNSASGITSAEQSHGCYLVCGLHTHHWLLLRGLTQELPIPSISFVSRLLRPWFGTFCSYLLALCCALLTTSYAFQGSSNIISPWLISSSQLCGSRVLLAVLGTEPKASCTLGEYCATELRSQPFLLISYITWQFILSKNFFLFWAFLNNFHN